MRHSHHNEPQPLLLLLFRQSFIDNHALVIGICDEGNAWVPYLGLLASSFEVLGDIDASLVEQARHGTRLEELVEETAASCRSGLGFWLIGCRGRCRCCLGRFVCDRFPWGPSIREVLGADGRRARQQRDSDGGQLHGGLWERGAGCEDTGVRILRMLDVLRVAGPVANVICDFRHNNNGRACGRLSYRGKLCVKNN